MLCKEFYNTKIKSHNQLTQRDYLKLKEDGRPEIYLTEYSFLMRHYIVASANPFCEDYRFTTRGLVSEDKAVEMVKAYLARINMLQ